MPRKKPLTENQAIIEQLHKTKMDFFKAVDEMLSGFLVPYEDENSYIEAIREYQFQDIAEILWQWWSDGKHGNQCICTNCGSSNTRMSIKELRFCDDCNHTYHGNQ